MICWANKVTQASRDEESVTISLLKRLIAGAVQIRTHLIFKNDLSSVPLIHMSLSVGIKGTLMAALFT